MFTGALPDHVGSQDIALIILIALLQSADKIFLSKFNIIIQNNNIAFPEMFSGILISLIICIRKAAIFFNLQNLDSGIPLIFLKQFLPILFFFLNIVIHDHNSNPFLLFHCQYRLDTGVCY